MSRSSKCMEPVEKKRQYFFAFEKKLCQYWLSWKKALYNILTGFGMHMKLFRLLKMCLNETYGKFRTGKKLSDAFSIQSGLKKWDALSQLLFLFALQYAIIVFFSRIGSWVKFCSLWVTNQRKGGLLISSRSSVCSEAMWQKHQQPICIVASSHLFLA
jgi:hypothetical protein